MATSARRAALDAAFRTAREQAIDALFAVMLAHQPEATARSAAEVRRRAQGIVIAMQEAIASDVALPGFIEEVGAVAFGVTDGGDDTLLAITTCLQDTVTGQAPANLVADVRSALHRETMRLMRGWLDRGAQEAAVSSPAGDDAKPASDSETDAERDGLLAGAAEQAPFAASILDLQAGRIVLFNPAMQQLFGYTMEEELALSPEDMQNEDSADDDFELLYDMLAGRIPFLERVSARPHKDGQSVPFHLVAWPIRAEDGTVTHLVNMFRDARTRPPGTDGSGLAEKRARFLMQISPDPVLITTADGIIHYASPSVNGALGEDPDVLIGRAMPSLMADGSAEGATNLLHAVAGVPRVRMTVELEFQLGDGSSRWFEVAATNMLDVEDVHGIVLQSRDITERRMLQATLETIARTEALTGLLNRRGVLERLDAWLTQRRASGPDNPDDASLVCFIDLDGFKSINDRYGYVSGDAVLADVGHRLSALIEGRGFAGRLGGDEFILLADLPDLASRQTFLTELGQALTGLVHHDGKRIAFSGSAGCIDVGGTHAKDDDAVAILKQADDELRRAKDRPRVR
ncbi:MAG: PAS domain S-box protein [Thermomicrobiales bacterium]